MKITPLHQDAIPDLIALMKLGKPFIQPRIASDFWLYATLFSSTCPIATSDDGHLAGALMAFRSQDHPENLYIQDVITHPDYRRRGVTTTLLAAVRDRATELGCRRLYLTSEPDNTAAHTTWTRRGFTNVPGDHTVNGVAVVSDYKGLANTERSTNSTFPLAPMTSQTRRQAAREIGRYRANARQVHRAAAGRVPRELHGAAPIGGAAPAKLPPTGMVPGQRRAWLGAVVADPPTTSDHGGWAPLAAYRQAAGRWWSSWGPRCRR